PLAMSSPFFKTLRLEKFGLEFIEPTIAAAHPFDDGNAAALYKSVEKTAKELSEDEHSYFTLIDPIVTNWPQIIKDLLGPLRFPKHPVEVARFGLKAIRSATHIAKRFHSERAKGLWAGMTAHSILPLSNAATSATGLVLMAAGHSEGWPM